MKNVFTKALASFALIGALVTQAHALAIFDVNAYGGGTINAGNTPNDFFYKFDVPGTESGDGASLLDTVISNGGLTATVTWAPTGSLDFDFIYLKASNEFIKWDVSGVNWSTYDGFTVTNDLIKNKKGVAQAISHIQADGGVTTTKVPDSGTSAILVGLGLIALGLFRRKIA